MLRALDSRPSSTYRFTRTFSGYASYNIYTCAWQIYSGDRLICTHVYLTRVSNNGDIERSRRMYRWPPVADGHQYLGRVQMVLAEAGAMPDKLGGRLNDEEL